MAPLDPTTVKYEDRLVGELTVAELAELVRGVTIDAVLQLVDAGDEALQGPAGSMISRFLPALLGRVS